MGVGSATSVNRGSVSDKAAAARAAEEARRRAEAARKAAEAARKAAEAAKKAAEAAKKAQAEKQRAAAEAKAKAAQHGQSPEQARKSKAAYQDAAKAEKTANAAVAQAQKELQSAEKKAATTSQRAESAMRQANVQAQREGKPAPFGQKDLQGVKNKPMEFATSFEAPQRQRDFEKLMGLTPQAPGAQAPQGAEASSLLTENAKDDKVNCLDLAADWMNKASPEDRARSEMVFLQDKRPGAEGDTGHVVVKQGDRVLDPSTHKSYENMEAFQADQPQYQEAGRLDGTQAAKVFSTPPNSPERKAALEAAGVSPSVAQMKLADQKPDPAKVADQKYKELAGNPEHRAALDQLGIKNGQDLIKLGDQLEKQSQTGAGPAKGDVDLTQVKDSKKLEKIVTAAGETRKDEGLKKVMSDPNFAKEVSEGKPPKEAKENTEIKQALGLSEKELPNLTRNQNARNAARTLVNGLIGQDPKPNGFQMANALGTLASQHSNVIRPEQLRKILGSDKVNKYFGQLPNGNSFLGAIGTMMDPKATPQAKAKAIFGAVNGMRGMVGAKDSLARFADEWRKMDGGFRAIGNGLTLFDSKASPQDRTMALLQLRADLPGLIRDGKELYKLLRENRVPDPEGLMKKSVELENRTVAQLPDDVKDKLGAPGSEDRARRIAALADLEARNIPVKDLGPALTRLSTPDALDNAVSQIKSGTTPEQAKKYFATIGALDPKVATDALQDPHVAERLKNLSDKMPLDLETDQLKGVLGAVRSKEGLDALTTRLDDVAKTDPKQANRLAKVLKGLDAQELDKVLRNAGDASQSLDHLAKMVGKLDDAGADNLAKVVKNMDAASLKAFTGMAEKIPQELLDQSLKLLTPVLEKTDSRIIGRMFKGLETLLTHLGVPMTEKVAGTVFKGLSKMIPGIGAIPGAYDAFKLGNEAGKLREQNKDLGYLALTGAKLNAIDAAGGLVLDATGVGAGLDLAAGMAFGVAELALDLGLHNEMAKMTEARQKGQKYEAPGWVKAVNLFAAAATQPTGPIDYVAYMGPKKAFEDAKWAIGQGGKLAEKAWDVIKAAGGKLGELADGTLGAFKDALGGLGDLGRKLNPIG